MACIYIVSAEIIQFEYAHTVPFKPLNLNLTPRSIEKSTHYDVAMCLQSESESESESGSGDVNQPYGTILTVKIQKLMLGFVVKFGLIEHARCNYLLWKLENCVKFVQISTVF